MPECTVHSGGVARKTNSRVLSYYQTDCIGGQAMRDVGGGIMVARGVALDVQLLVTRRTTRSVDMHSQQSALISGTLHVTR